MLPGGAYTREGAISSGASLIGASQVYTKHPHIFLLLLPLSIPEMEGKLPMAGLILLPTLALCGR